MKTPLHAAAKHGETEACQLLMNLGANLDALDDVGLAKYKKNGQLILFLIIYRAVKPHCMLLLSAIKKKS